MDNITAGQQGSGGVEAGGEYQGRAHCERLGADSRTHIVGNVIGADI